MWYCQAALSADARADRRNALPVEVLTEIDIFELELQETEGFHTTCFGSLSPESCAPKPQPYETGPMLLEAPWDLPSQDCPTYLGIDPSYLHTLDFSTPIFNPVRAHVVDQAGPAQMQETEQYVLGPSGFRAKSSHPNLITQRTKDRRSSGRRFRVVLDAPTAMIKFPADKRVTYLNKRQAYRITIRDSMLNPIPAAINKYHSFVRVSFDNEQQKKDPSAHGTSGESTVERRKLNKKIINSRQ